jgi:hypothetical protein
MTMGRRDVVACALVGWGVQGLRVARTGERPDLELYTILLLMIVESSLSGRR